MKNIKFYLHLFKLCDRIKSRNRNYRMIRGCEMINSSINDNYINYILDKWAQLRNYVARLTAFVPFRGRGVSKIKYNYIKVE